MHSNTLVDFPVDSKTMTLTPPIPIILVFAMLSTYVPVNSNTVYRPMLKHYI